jgi:hypothetical protein
LQDETVNIAICSLIFAEERFTEIVFLAVGFKLQSVGHGTLVMNDLNVPCETVLSLPRR